MWGNELYIRSVLYINPLFEKLFTQVIEEKTQKDRIEGSKMIAIIKSSNQRAFDFDESRISHFDEQNHF